MTVLGMSCNVRNSRVTTRGVAIEGGQAWEAFVHRASADDDEALQLRLLRDAFETRLNDLTVQSVVIRTADHHHAARLTKLVAFRLRAEGVLLATARSRFGVVQAMTGRAIAELLGMTKAEVEAMARGLLGPSHVDATCAVLAAEKLL